MPSYVGKYTPQKTNSPLDNDQLMSKKGDQFRGGYDAGLKWVEGTKKFGLDVNAADKIRFGAMKMRTKTHGPNAWSKNDDQA